MLLSASTAEQISIYPDHLSEHSKTTPFHNRKNWLFSHTPSGAQASAAIYSLIETAKANGLSPYDYLQYVFATLPTLDDDDFSTLLPWQWKETLPI